MTKEEVKKLAGWAVANFPGQQNKSMGPTAELWFKMLADLPFQLAENALVKVLATARYFPTVAEIRQAAVDLTRPALKTWDEAFGELEAAIREYDTYRADEAMQALSPDVAEMVKRFGGFTELCTTDKDQWNTVRAQWRQAWEGHMAREREMAVLPANLRQLVSRTAKVLGGGDGHDKEH